MARRHWTGDELLVLRAEVADAVARISASGASSGHAEGPGADGAKPGSSAPDYDLDNNSTAGPLSAARPSGTSSSDWAPFAVAAVLLLAVAGVGLGGLLYQNNSYQNGSLGGGAAVNFEPPPSQNDAAPATPDSGESAAPGLAQATNEPSYSPPVESTPTTQFSIINNTSNTVNIGFYDGNNRNEIDPAGGRVYLQAGKATQSYSVSCAAGQLVCYGAVKAGGVFNPYWGVGYAGKQNCTECCAVCPGVSTQVLNERDARRPTPQVTFEMTNSTSIMLSVAFYAENRYHSGWPGWDRNWSMHIGENNFTLACRAGEKICYGVWPFGNTNGIHWGVGPFRRFGCTNCCVTCDGGTHVIPAFVIQGME